jgi:peptidoglycan/LPS O-acetylase OafA/YrhL
MIQRKQTLFLLAAVGLLIAMLFAPLAKYADKNVYYTSSWIILSLLITSIAAALVTIFLYRRRMWQVRLCIVHSVLLLGLQSIVIHSVITAVPDAVFSLTAAFPLVAVILVWLAVRYILLDEAKIKALDRLR